MRRLLCAPLLAAEDHETGLLDVRPSPEQAHFSELSPTQVTQWNSPVAASSEGRQPRSVFRVVAAMFFRISEGRPAASVHFRARAYVSQLSQLTDSTAHGRVRSIRSQGYILVLDSLLVHLNQQFVFLIFPRFRRPCAVQCRSISPQLHHP